MAVESPVPFEPVPTGEEPTLELVAKARAGERDAWDELYRRVHDPLLFAVRARLGARLRGALESEDVLQSVVKDALVDLERFEPRGPGSLQRWLATCVLNKIRTHAARQEVRERVEHVEPEALERATPHDARETGDLRYLAGERFVRLERALDALSTEMREVVLLRAIEGQDNAEAAARLGKSPDATSKLYNRALARLALAVGEEAGR
jgi:RNA polymerase sigma-70 factor (ECF subfamily)